MPETKMRTPLPEPFFAISPERFLQRAKAPARLLHITNGSIAADILRESGVPGLVTITADVLHEGPTPAGLPPERWRKVRARYLAESGYGGYDECLSTLTEWDHALEDHRTVDEMVLWFEHDLFDQLLLIRTLDGLASRDLGLTRLSLICIGEHPEVKPFHGLGQLSPEQMAALLETRRPVTRDQMVLARHAWRAFCAAEPIGIEVAIRRDTSTLPFLAGALHRHLQEFPALRGGLSRTERQALEALAAAGGSLSFEDLFRASQDLEERRFLGDTSFLRRLQELSDDPRRLVRLEREPGGGPRGLRVILTATGQEVLDGRDDWVRVHGIDRWLGGVHLHGREAQWRWDAERDRLVPGALVVE
ncbi:MAG TPA: hypothetical protein VKM72_31420 [Thermoanaerobaculia bacterium]|nr:hypothetical protein [Thermoanaerobaculia bacterium]